MSAPEKTYEIRDPIHGLVPFNDLEREVINSAAFQRLRRIRQLAWTGYVYRGAMAKLDSAENEKNKVLSGKGDHGKA
jgi:hypothetical protein